MCKEVRSSRVIVGRVVIIIRNSFVVIEFKIFNILKKNVIKRRNEQHLTDSCLQDAMECKEY